MHLRFRSSKSNFPIPEFKQTALESLILSWALWREQHRETESRMVCFWGWPCLTWPWPRTTSSTNLLGFGEFYFPATFLRSVRLCVRVHDPGKLDPIHLEIYIARVKKGSFLSLSLFLFILAPLARHLVSYNSYSTLTFFLPPALIELKVWEGVRQVLSLHFLKRKKSLIIALYVGCWRSGERSFFFYTFQYIRKLSNV